MLLILRKKRFEKDAEHAKRRGEDLAKLKAVLTYLITQNPLPKHYKNHNNME